MCSGTITCDDESSRYVACGRNGSIELEMTCPLGCAPDEAKCLDVDPSNGLALYLDMARSGPDVVFTGDSTINAVNGTVFNGGTSIDVPHVALAGVNVLMFRTVRITGTLTFERGDQVPVAILVDGDIAIEGLLDISAMGWMAGPGGHQGFDEADGGPCDGQQGYAPGGASPSPGGGGGGNFAMGGAGGSTTAASGGTGGTSMPESDLEPLRGGCAGGQTQEGGAFLFGGGGGGGIQIVSRTAIRITGAGVIDASGGGGGSLGGGLTMGGAGGGSGGSVLLEAPQIVLDGDSVVISTKGGGGAAVATGSSFVGADGGYGPEPASGGTSGTLPAGGRGGTETLAPGAGQSAASSSEDGGGGGGSVGRVRFNTSSGAINPQNGAAIRSRYTTGTLRTRRVP